MKVLKIGNKDYVVKFTSKVIRELNAKGITLNTLLADMEQMKLDKLYEAFFYSVRDMNGIKSLDEAMDILDQYYDDDDEENDIEKFFTMLMEEYAKAMGLGKKFKELMAEQMKKME